MGNIAKTNVRRFCKVCNREFVGIASRRTCSPECAAVLAKETKRKYNAAHPHRTKPGYKPPVKRAEDIDVSLRVKVEQWLLLPPDLRWEEKKRWPKKNAAKMDAIARKIYIKRHGLFPCYGFR